DTHALKGDMIRALYPDKPEATAVLQRNSKVTRGFRHPFLGGLFVKDDLISTPSLASTAAWPLFFYPHGQFDPDNLSKGLLRGELLIWACKHIFLGPSKWLQGSELTISEACNAKKHRMTSVTPHLIAYITIQVRFALSSGSTNTKTGGAFCPGAFFWHVKYIEDPQFEDDIKELVAWWNRYIITNFISFGFVLTSYVDKYFPRLNHRMTRSTKKTRF
ncbi:hypothetical protein M422DRAFT_163757, partial [Sphaerobolus stellatus SS14]